ncbi:MAG: hypothetical protein CMF50_08460 [Legionellales bacterium]|nr:hypothetical protein [Legionellales bacterium]
MTCGGSDVSVVADAIGRGHFQCRAAPKLYDAKLSTWAKPFVAPVASLQGMPLEERLYTLAKQTLLPLLEMVTGPFQVHWCLPRELTAALAHFYRGLPALFGCQAVFHPAEMGFTDIIKGLRPTKRDEIIILGSAMSYLENDCLQQQLQQQTLMTATNTEGLAPGEGAGFLAFKPVSNLDSKQSSSMRCIGKVNAEEFALLLQEKQVQVLLPTYGCPTTVKAWHSVRRFCQRLSVNNTQVFMPALMSAKNQLGYLGVAAWPIALALARHMSQQQSQPMLVCDAVDETQFEVVYVCG